MYKQITRLLLLIAGTFSGLISFAQEKMPPEKPEMAEAMRSNGKIYVVIAVLLVILSGLIFYVVRVDRKISRLEKN